jgi:hypothetical protein
VSVDPIKVKGLTEFRKALKDMDGESQKQLRVVFNRAADVVAGGARQGVTSRSGRARGSVRVLSSQTAAKVAGGGARAPHYPWLDFGGRVGEGRRIYRPFLRDGRYIYATFRNRRAWFVTELERGMDDLVTGAGLAVS